MHLPVNVRIVFTTMADGFKGRVLQSGVGLLLPGDRFIPVEGRPLHLKMCGNLWVVSLCSTAYMKIHV